MTSTFSEDLGRCDNLLVTICAGDQLRITDNCQDPPLVRQKIVSVDPGPAETHWSFDQLLDIGCFLHDAPEFKTETFRKHAGLVTYLGWVLYHNYANRVDVAGAILALMHVWEKMCQDDTGCIVPPSLESMQDPQQQKVLAKIDQLKNALKREKTEKAEIAQQNTRPLTALEQALLENQQQAQNLRIRY